MGIKCKYCGSENTKTYIKVKDHFLTKEEFEIIECKYCRLLFTYPEPSPSEIGKYYKSEDYLSHNENKKGFIPLIYNIIKKRNIKYKIKITTNIAKGTRLLDYGCGVGDFLLHAQKSGLEVCGCDINEEARRIASNKLNTPILTPEEALALPHSSFDIITMWHSLEHISDTRGLIEKLYDLLSPEGHLIIAVPNFKSYDAEHYKDKWAAYDVPRHLYHFSTMSIERILQDKFNLISIRPLKWDAFYISMMSEKYKNSKFPFIKGILTGLISNMAASQTGQYSSLIHTFTKI